MTFFSCQLEMPPAAVLMCGAPVTIYLQYTVSADAPTDIQVNAQWFNKTATRLPESLWFSVIPKLPAAPGGWLLNKVCDLNTHAHSHTQVIPLGCQSHYGLALLRRSRLMALE